MGGAAGAPGKGIWGQTAEAEGAGSEVAWGDGGLQVSGEHWGHPPPREGRGAQSPWLGPVRPR